MAARHSRTTIQHLHAQAQDRAAATVLPEEIPAAAAGGGIAPPVLDIYAPEAYFNRELSWLEFNQRVLNEALDPSVPLLERVKFVAIVSANLDEFFMIRVAGLRQQLELDVPDVPPDGMTPDETLDRIAEDVSRMMHTMNGCFVNEIVPGLAEEGIVLHPYDTIDDQARTWCEQYFYDDVYPVLTPLAIDPGHPFPHLLNRSLNLLIVIIDSKTREERIAVVQVPQILTRLVPLPTYARGAHFVLLGDIIGSHADALFPGLDVKAWYRFRITRNADLEIADDEASDLLTMIEEKVRRRRWGAAVRLEIDARLPKRHRKLLMRAMQLGDRDVYPLDGPLNLADFMILTRLPRRGLKDKPFVPRPVPDLGEDEDIFTALRKRDIFLHHPYHSFETVVDFIECAADDPSVLAIKQTLYRTSGDSAIIRALERAAANGKQVTAFVELKARFDEENNIIWARKLEQAGVHVVYGILGLKTHCKIAIVVRREKKGLRTYVHVSTGNYNEVTARQYTDFGLLSCREEIGYEASALFNYLTGYSHRTQWEKLIIAPISMRQRLLSLIHREQEQHRPDNPGHIIAKLNALVDAQIIRALYRASQAGVKIDLLVRGICCLRPGIPGLSENIRVRSVLGRFLEHSRVVVFRNGGNHEVYLTSADWMPRNLNRRVELMLRVDDSAVKRILIEDILPVYLRDDADSYELRPDGTYTRPPRDNGAPATNVMSSFIERTERAYRRAKREADDD